MLQWLNLNKVGIILVLFTFFVAGSMIILNDINIKVRLKELKISLQKNDTEENNIDHINLIMKYSLHKKMYENKYSEDKADKIELKVHKILAERPSYEKVTMDKYQFLSLPVVNFINLFRKVTGKPPIRDIENEGSLVYLHIAYYYERNKYYSRALDTYNKALDEGGLQRSMVAGIMLHQGFCHAILGNYKKAKRIYKTIILEYGDQNIAVTAAILLKYLEGFRSEYMKVLAQEKDPLIKSEKLYKLLAYKESIEVLENLQKKVPASQLTKILFYKGKCYEELGEKEKAVNTFMSAIVNDYRSHYAILSNRRIYIISSHLEQEGIIQKIAVRINNILKDSVLTEIINEDKEKEIKNKKKKISLTKSKILKMEREHNTKNDPTSKNYGIYTDTKIKVNPILVKQLKQLDQMAVTTENVIKTNKRVKIFTIDGNIFVGEITSHQGDTLILNTVIGKIRINKSRIRKMKYQ